MKLSLEYLRKIYINMLEEGYGKEEVIKNLFLNYSTFVDDNQVIYSHKDKISKEFNIDLRNIFLIGSRHIGLKIENKELKFKSEFDENTDYDYAIIDANLFSRYFDQYESEDKKYLKNLCKGFLHPLYNKPLKAEIEKKIGNIPGKISICIYLSEKSFVRKLYKHYGEIIFKKISEIPILDQVETLGGK